MLAAVGLAGQNAARQNCAQHIGKAMANRNGKCVTYSSPKLAALVRAMPDAAATVSGVGSVAHTDPVPAQYTVTSCSLHGPPMGNITLLGVPGAAYTPQLGTTHRWCTACCTWVLMPGHHRYVPKPAKAPLTATQQAANVAARANGGEPIYRATAPKYSHGNYLTPASGLLGGKYTKR